MQQMPSTVNHIVQCCHGDVICSGNVRSHSYLHHLEPLDFHNHIIQVISVKFTFVGEGGGIGPLSIRN